MVTTLNLTMKLKDLHHELRTPLTGSLGAARLLLNTPLNAEQQELVEMLIKSNERLLSFINNQLLNNPTEKLASNLVDAKSDYVAQRKTFLKTEMSAQFFRPMALAR